MRRLSGLRAVTPRAGHLAAAVAGLLICLPAIFAAAGPKERLLKLIPKAGAWAGWERRGQPTFFGRDTLFEYIDGAANAYLEQGFQGLAAADFLPGGEGPDFVTVDLYDMKDAAHARRVYQKSACQSRPAGAGTQSCTGANHLYFHKGRYFVKLAASSSKEPVAAAMLALARATAAAMAPAAGKPPR